MFVGARANQGTSLMGLVLGVAQEHSDQRLRKEGNLI